MADNPNNTVEINDSAGKPRQRHKLAMIAAVIAVIGLVLGIRHLIHASLYQSTDDAFLEGHIAQISTKVSGNVTGVYVEDNQKVKKGDLLVQINPKDYLARVEEARGEYLTAVASRKGASINVGLTNTVSTAQLQQAGAGVDFYQYSAQSAQDQIALAQSRLGEAQAQVVQARSQALLARQDYERYRALFEQGAVSRQQLDTAAANLQAANAGLTSANKAVAGSRAVIAQSQAQLRAAQASIKQSRGRLKEANTVSENVAISKSQLENASAKIEQLRGVLRQAELNLSYTKIYAPSAGYVTRRAVERGNYVQPGQALMALVPNKVWVVANFKETQLKNMKPGQIAYINVDTYPHKRFKGHVDSIQRGTGARFSLLPPENAVGSYVKVVQRVPVKIVFDEKPDPKYLLAPGMSVVPEVRVK